MLDMFALREAAADELIQGLDIALPTEQGPEGLEGPDAQIRDGWNLKGHVKEKACSRICHVTMSRFSLEIQGVLEQEMTHDIDGEILG